MQGAWLPGRAFAPRWGVLNPGCDCGGRTQPRGETCRQRPGYCHSLRLVAWILSPSFGSPSDCAVGPESSDLKKLPSPERGSQGSVWPGATRMATTPQPISLKNLSQRQHVAWERQQSPRQLWRAAQAAPVPADGRSRPLRSPLLRPVWLQPDSEQSLSCACPGLPPSSAPLPLVGLHTLQSKPDPPPVSWAWVQGAQAARENLVSLPQGPVGLLPPCPEAGLR